MKQITITLANMDNDSLWDSIDTDTVLIVPYSTYSKIGFSSVVFMNRLKKLAFNFRLVEVKRDWNIFFDL